MTPDRYNQVMQILDAVIDCDLAQREAILAEACGTDESLRREVEGLMAHHNPAAEFMEESPFDTCSRRDESLIGKHIGPYRITDEIGRGGMGVVYLAERDDQQFAKRVAIKLIKRGMDTDFVVQRFRNERQILANLDHPNIARLLDGGATEADLPYFVMEFVEGDPIIKYANANKLSTSERLELFRTVCSAVQYAHQNLVIHRDLKPSNILVTKDGAPKLLDFGIAKLLQADGEAETAFTATAVRVMTPEYASPEQIKGERITTSSDVYSLGVLLYELLTGNRPYRVRSHQPEEIARAICDQEPTKPSAARGSQELGVGGQSDGSDLKFLRGDLDNIVLKALRKEPQRRYASVEQFSEDIRRHLEGLPVSARRDTLWYRTSKFIQRNKIGVAAAAIILLTLIGGIIGTAWQAHKARLEKALAEQRFNDVRKLADTYMFEFYDSIKDLPGSLSARQLVIKRALEYLDSLANEAGDDRGLQVELANAYEKVGTITFDLDQMIDTRMRCMRIREKLVAADPNNKTYRNSLASSYGDMQDAMKIAGNTPAELEYARKAVETIEAVPASQRDATIRQTLVDGYLTLGYAQDEMGDSTSAIASARRAVTGQTTIVADKRGDREALRELSITYVYLSRMLEHNGEYAEALDYGSKQTDIAREMLGFEMGNMHYQRDIAMGLLREGRLRLELGNPSQALQNLNISLEQLQKLSSADPTDKGHRLWLAVNYLTLGQVQQKLNRSKEAVDDYSKAVAILQALISSDAKWQEARRYLNQTYVNLGSLLSQTGETSTAEDYLQKGITSATESSNADPRNVRTRSELAEAYTGMARFWSNLIEPTPNKRLNAVREARAYYQRSLDIYQDEKNKGTLSGSDANKPDELAKEIAKCDGALRK